MAISPQTKIRELTRIKNLLAALNGEFVSGDPGKSDVSAAISSLDAALAAASADVELSDAQQQADVDRLNASGPVYLAWLANNGA